MKTKKMDLISEELNTSLAPNRTLLKTASVAVLILGIISSSIELLAFGYFMVVCVTHVLLLIWPGLLGAFVGILGITYTRRPENGRLLGVLLGFSILAVGVSVVGLGFHSYEIHKARYGEPVWNSCHRNPCQIPSFVNQTLHQDELPYNNCPDSDRKLVLVNFAFSLLVDTALMIFSLIIFALTFFIMRIKRRLETPYNTTITTIDSKEDLRHKANNGRVSLVSYGFDVV